MSTAVMRVMAGALPLALVACGAVGPSTESTLRASFDGNAAFPAPSAVIVEAAWGTGGVTWRGADFLVRAAGDVPRSGRVGVPSRGALTVQATLRLPDGTVAATAQGSTALGENTDFGVQALIRDRTPLPAVSSRLIGRAAVRVGSGLTGDTLFLLFGGCPRDAVC